jgi:hypothetical protein
MKVVSFIGQNPAYQPCCYKYGDKEVRTHLFPFAVTQFFETTSLLVFLTPKAAIAKASFKPEEEEKAINYFNGLAALYNLQSLRAREKTYFEQLCEIHQANKLVGPTPMARFCHPE